MMSYNILADSYAREYSKDLYSNVPWSVLAWDKRVRLVAKEVAHYKPDIVCFQEVDHYEHLRDLLQEHGYTGSYVQRTGGRPDGLATFWREKAFAVVSLHTIEFAALGLKDNVCQLTLLKKMPEHGDSAPKGDVDCSILIANIHVLFNPKRGDIKLAQVRTMLEEADRIAKNSKFGGCPIIACGDFNSAVGSPMYNFITRGKLDLHSTDRRTISGQIEASGRRGWPSIRNNFYLAMNKGGTTEHDALHAANGHHSSPGLLDGDRVLARTIRVEEDAGSAAASSSHSCDTHVKAALENDIALGVELGCSSSDCSEMGESNTNLSNTKQPRHSQRLRTHRAWSADELQMATGVRTDSGTEMASVVCHPLKLHSAFATVTGEEPVYTTVHDKYVGTVDYIFYTPEAHCNFGNISLRPFRARAPPPLRTLHYGLPSKSWPSDHVCLVVDFELGAACPEYENTV
jgi:mRNA deadenylase 3'-5' endonuclease subunit Ccr4